MSNTYALAANVRDRAGKGVARALRRESLIPAVIYGDNQDPVMISLPEKELWIEYNKGHMHTNLVELALDNSKKVQAIARDIQTNPVTDRIEHVDFLRVGPKTKVNVNVPVHFVGQENSPGLKAKGILNINHHELEVRVLAVNIPEALEVDLSEAEIGQHIKASSIKLPEGGAIVSHEKDPTVATILEPLVKEVVAAPAAPAKGGKAAAKK